MKKKINIILLVGVLGLWCTVIYKYVDQYFFAPQITADIPKHYQSVNAILKAKDTFELNRVHRDPFLNKSFVAVKAPGTSKRRIVARPQKVHAPLQESIPSIRYFGYIKKQGDAQKELVLLEVDGKMEKVKIGEQKENFKILNVYKDSVKILINKKVHYIRR